MAKAVGEWDIDKLEREMPRCAIAEWNDYLDYEMATMARAILGALPAARAMSEAVPEIRLTKPEDIGKLFDGLGAKTRA